MDTVRPSGAARILWQRTVLFESAGIQDYFCDFHPSMRGRVVVE